MRIRKGEKIVFEKRVFDKDSKMEGNTPKTTKKKVKKTVKKKKTKK